MSIASELSALNGYILGAYDEVDNKGGTVPQNKNMANLASAIGSISTGSSTTITPLNVTDNGTYTAPAGTAYSPVTVNVSGGGGGIDLSGFFGLSAGATGSFTGANTTTQSITHNLGVTPKIIIFATTAAIVNWRVKNIKLGVYVDLQGNVAETTIQHYTYESDMVSDSNGTTATSVTSSSAVLQAGGVGRFINGATYYWVALG